MRTQFAYGFLTENWYVEKGDKDNTGWVHPILSERLSYFIVSLNTSSSREYCCDLNLRKVNCRSQLLSHIALRILARPECRIVSLYPGLVNEVQYFLVFNCELYEAGRWFGIVLMIYTFQFSSRKCRVFGNFFYILIIPIKDKKSLSSSSSSFIITSIYTFSK